MHRRPDMMALLAADVPITLVIDLFGAAGPHSDQILDQERPAVQELQWLTAAGCHRRPCDAPAPPVPGLSLPHMQR